MSTVTPASARWSPVEPEDSASVSSTKNAANTTKAAGLKRMQYHTRAEVGSCMKRVCLLGVFAFAAVVLPLQAAFAQGGNEIGAVFGLRTIRAPR